MTRPDYLDSAPNTTHAEEIFDAFMAQTTVHPLVTALMSAALVGFGIAEATTGNFGLMTTAFFTGGLTGTYSVGNLIARF